jgi:dTDP-glucose 4,6-dehydratase
MDNILITGGAGFIGSHLVERVADAIPEAKIAVFDKMTYAADRRNLDHVLDGAKRMLVTGNVCDFDLCVRLTKGIDCVIHAAAESHVDNAFGNSLEFTRSNTLGTHTLLEAARLNNVPLFVHISTDEVYGEIREGLFDENSPFNPSNPYSGSKASAEMIVNSYRYSFDTPIITVRANNIFGIRQYPEKIIPKFAMQALTGNRMSVHGNGTNRRSYLAAEDLAEAMVLLMREGKIGEIYNVGSTEEFTNIDIAEMICAHFGLDPKRTVQFVDDRPFNDFRYSIDFAKIARLGWKSERRFEESLPDVLGWYEENKDRYVSLFTGDGTGRASGSGG